MFIYKLINGLMYGLVYICFYFVWQYVFSFFMLSWMDNFIFLFKCFIFKSSLWEYQIDKQTIIIFVYSNSVKICKCFFTLFDPQRIRNNSRRQFFMSVLRLGAWDLRFDITRSICGLFLDYRFILHWRKLLLYGSQRIY